MKGKLLKLIGIMAVLLALPLVSALSFSPATAYTNNDITCNIASPGLHQFKWFNGGQIATGQTLSNSLTTRGQTYTCNTYVNIFGSWILDDTGSITVVNSPPIITSLSFLNLPYFANSLVDMSATANDIDGDALTYTYDFSIGAVLLQSGASNTYNCTGTCLKNDIINATVTVTDGTDTVSLSNFTTIQNSPPNALAITTAPGALFVGTTLTATGVGADIDTADVLTYTYQFVDVNTSATLQAYSATDTLVIPVSAAHNTIRVFSNVSDGSASLENSTNVVVSNTLPVWSIGPITFDQDTNYSLNLSTVASDADFDAPTFNGAGSLNLALSFSGTNVTITPDAGFIGTQTIDLNASDGYGNVTVTVTVNVLDTQDPSVVIDAPLMDELINSTNNVTLNYTIADNGVLDTCWYTSDFDSGGLLNCITGSFDFAGIFNGNHSITVFANDSRNNVNSSIVNFTMDYNTEPVVSSSSINPLAPYANDTLNCSFTIIDDEQTSLTVFYDWFNDTSLISSGSMAVLNNTLGSTTLGVGNFAKNDNITCQITPFDSKVNGTAVNATVTILNSDPTSSAIPNQMWQKDTNGSLNLTGYFSDIDGDALNYTSTTPANVVVLIDNSTGMITFVPDAGFVGTNTVTFDAIDSDGATVTSNVVTLTVGYNTVDNSTINGTFYVAGFYANIPGVITSTINASTISGTIIDIIDSFIFNSVITDATLNNCTVLDSTVIGGTCTDSTIDPSDVQNSNVTASTITNSTVYNSTVTNSIIIDGFLQNVTSTNSYVFNSTLLNTIITDANVTNDVLYTGTMLMSNGSVYNATLNGPQPLTQLVNYAPNAVIALPLNNSNFATGQTIDFNDSSTDVNIGTLLGDSLTYSWNFGDGNTAATANATHAYAVAGLYTATLSATDSFGLQSNATVTVRASDAPAISFASPLNQTYASAVLVNISSNGQSVWFNNGTANVTYSTPVSLNLADGSYTFTAYANNSYGIMNQTSISFSVDQTPPLIAIMNPASGAYSNRTLLVNLTNSSDAANIWFSWNGTNQVYTGPVYVDFAEGNNTLTAYANDSLGNLNQTNVSFTVDTTPPHVAFNSPLNQTYSSYDILVNLTNSSDAANVWFFNGTGNVTYTGPVYVTFPAGSNTVIAYANDSLGNVNQTSMTFSIVIPSPPSSGGGSGGSSTITHTITSMPIFNNGMGADSRRMNIGDYVYFTFNGTIHRVTLMEVYSSFVKIKVESTPVEAFLDKNSSAKFNLNADGFYDLDVRLDGIYSDGVDLTFKLINEAIVNKTSGNETVPVKDTTTEKTTETVKRTGLWNSLTGNVTSSFNGRPELYAAVFIAIFLLVGAAFGIRALVRSRKKIDKKK